ncbi:MAG: SUMF1/EgtB/PvdO family nonheme iron enzyme, partial [Pseudomonadota bacterium]
GARYDSEKLATGATAPVGSHNANAFGLYDVLGNVSEWVEDCYVNNFSGTPTDGSAATEGDCGRRVVRGGGWRSSAGDLRVANRSRITTTQADRAIGFRVAASID